MQRNYFQTTLASLWPSYFSSPPAPAPTTPSRSDVFATLRYLSTRLPIELAVYILDLAEYYTVETIERHDKIVVNSRNAATAGSYVISEPLEGGLQDSPWRLKSITITLTSHDQGWSDTPRLRGTYDQSYTWFDLCIQRLVEITDEGEESSEQLLEPLELQRNKHATVQSTTHIIRLPSSHPYLQQLRTGDRLCIQPEARFPVSVRSRGQSMHGIHPLHASSGMGKYSRVSTGQPNLPLHDDCDVLTRFVVCSLTDTPKWR